MKTLSQILAEEVLKEAKKPDDTWKKTSKSQKEFEKIAGKNPEQRHYSMNNYDVIVNKKGTFWYKTGTNILHRLDGPAVEQSNRKIEWYKHGKLHRDNGPAVEFFNGSKEWYVDGKLHRLDGPAVEWADGYKAWYVNGKRHRLNDPAVEMPNGSKEWYVDGKLHRLDGPAVKWADGSKEWWIEGKKTTEKQFNKKTKINESNETFSQADLTKLKRQDFPSKSAYTEKDLDKIYRHLLQIYSVEDAIEIVKSRHMRYAADYEEASYEGFKKYYQRNLKQIEKLL